MSENYICLVNNSTQKVNGIYPDTPTQRITLSGVTGTTYTVQAFSMTLPMGKKNWLWNGTTIVNDDAQDATDLAAIKDINNTDKLIKAGFMVIMDYLRGMGLSKTNVQFSNV